VDAVRNASIQLQRPVILITHIPLHKPPYSCAGDLVPIYHASTVHKAMHIQTHLTHNTTRELLERLHPAMIFTGHDHEGCYYEHVHNDVRIPEHTVRVIQGSHSGYTALLEIDLHAFNETTYRVTLIPFLQTDVYLLFVYVTAAWFIVGIAFTIKLWREVTKVKRD